MANISEEDRIDALANFLGLDTEDRDGISVQRYGKGRRLEYGREEYLVVTDEEADEEFKDHLDSVIDDMGIEPFSKDFIDWIMNHAVDEKKFWRDYKSNIEESIIESPDSYLSFFESQDKGAREKLVKELEKDEKAMQFGKYKNDLMANLGIDFEEYFTEDDSEEASVQQYLTDAKSAIGGAEIDEILNAITYSGFSVEDYFDISDVVEEYISQYNSPYDYLEDICGGGEDLNNALKDFIDWDEVIYEVKKTDGRGPMLAGYDGEENEEGDFYIYRIN